MAVARLRVTPPFWLRPPRRTARLRLTLLYGGLFLASGAILLTITYLLFEQAIDNGHAVRVPRGASSAPVIVGTSTHQMQASIALANRELAAQRSLDLHQLLVNSGIALAIVAALALLLGWYVAGRVLRPVRTITAAARGISASNLHERLTLDGADEEFKDLGDTLNELFARLEASFDAQRHFVANASHELRTPLTRERTLLQVALDDPSTSSVWRSAGEELLASNREQERLIEALLALASSEGGLDNREKIDLAAICDDVLLRPDLDIGNLGLHVETAISSAPLDGDSRLIERLVSNLADNAVRHNVIGGHVQISTAVSDGRAVLSVTNTGSTIPPSEIDRIFQPFQRLDPRRTRHKDGHGLGLSIVAAIATAHGATITAHPEPEGGLSVRITFPVPRNANGLLDRSPRNGRPSEEHRANRSKIVETHSVAHEIR
jgi:signal transduction histidine kinase